MKLLLNRPTTALVAASLGLICCGAARSAAAEPAANINEIRAKALEVFGVLPDKMPGSEKDTPEKVELGRKLFFDTRLSANQTQSCNSCHAVDQRRAGVDGERTSEGAFGKRGGRNSPTVLNAGYHVAQFWDGRAATLEDQAKGPILNPIEMAMPNQGEVLSRLEKEESYVKSFAKAFPGTGPAITYDNVANAIAAFERTLRTHDRLDDFLKGNDKALSATELKGLDTFVQTGCSTCHNGPLVGASTFQKVGLINAYENTSDLGRFEVTKDDSDKLKFKVPSLRNVALTAPYFHDGAVAKLEQVVPKMAWMQLGRELSETETKSIVAFLTALSDKERGAEPNKRAALQ